MIRNLFLIIFLFTSGLIYAQTDNSETKGKGKKEHYIQLIGSVKNSFTKWGIGDARVSVYDEDGNLLTNLFVLTFGDRPKKGNEFRFSTTNKSAKYRFHAECNGYEPTDLWYEVKNIGRTKVINLPDLLMQRDFKNQHEDLDQELDEVIVKATKIKMYHKGDTIIFNADAFNLPEGSMLDDLIRQMPGAELKDNGEIFINGRKLDFLTLNGKDFFGHNNKIMLDNLPYYTISQLKVFEQSSIRSLALGHDVDAKLYVMDVRLKKEYSIGYLGNVTGGIGTKDRYLGRLFGLRFSDNTRLSLFGNSNNVNESRKPGADSEWKPSDMTIGTENRHNGGLDIMIDDSEGRFTENGNVTFSWTKTTGETHTASESFLNSGNAFGRSINNNKAKSISVNLNNTFTIKKPYFFDFKTTANYNKRNFWADILSASFNSNPDSYGETVAILDSLMHSDLNERLYDITLNHTENRTKNNGESYSLGQTARFLKSLKWGDDLEINANVNYNNSKAHEYSLYNLEFLQSETQQNEFRNRYNNSPDHSYSYMGKALYRFNFLNKMNLELSYRYAQNYKYTDRSKYRLDQIDEWDNNEYYKFGTLPSSRELLRLGLDRQNSYTSGYLNRENQISVFFRKTINDIHNIEISGNLKKLDERNNYNSYVLDTVMYRNQWILTPNATYEYKPKKKVHWRNSYRIQYQMLVDAPLMSLMVPVRNTYNPLAIMTGNSYLKNTTNNFILISINNEGRGWWMFHGGRINFQRNLVATGFSFNNKTGVYTYKPENVNGNWYIDLRQTINKNLDKAKRIHLQHQLDFTQRRNVDLTTPVNDTIIEDLYSIRSIVNTSIFNETLKITYSRESLHIGLIGTFIFRHTTSDRENFTTINACDFSYGVNGQYTFPWKIQLATDLKMYSRRGYGDSNMNSNDLIWNASVSRPFFKGNLVTILQGFDLLHNLSNVTYNINAQGRTEIWNRSIPSYLMLHLQYKFHKNPKKKI